MKNITLKKAKELLKLATQEIKQWEGFKKEIEEVIEKY